jgi:hypothetical protein
MATTKLEEFRPVFLREGDYVAAQPALEIDPDEFTIAYRLFIVDGPREHEVAFAWLEHAVTNAPAEWDRACVKARYEHGAEGISFREALVRLSSWLKPTSLDRY